MKKVKQFLHWLFPGLGVVKPSDNNSRRLVKNKDGKYVFTEGESKFKPTTVDELNSDKIYRMKYAKDAGNTVLYERYIGVEPLRGSRYIIHFPGVEPYLIQNFKKYDNSASIDIILPLSTGVFEYMYELKDSCNGNQKPKKLKDDVKIELLAPDGEVVHTVVFEKPKVCNVEILGELSYGTNDLLHASLNFEYEKETLLEYKV